MFDAMAPEGKNSTYRLSRRQALITIATLPLTYSANTGGDGAVELFVSRCAASLTACWHLLKGSNLYTVNEILSPYLLELERIAQQQSIHQQTAARLASQAHRICGIVALHRSRLRMREYHCRQALRYATFANDASSQVSALISLASTHYYDAAPSKAADVYEEAFSFEASMSPLQRSRVHAELSVVYGQLGRERQALQSADLAERLYPAAPEQDVSFLYAEFTRASLTLERGLSYAALAERHPGRQYQRKAAETFGLLEQAAPTTVPDRIRYEILNHQASTAVLLDDLDAFETYLDRAAGGVVHLGSRQRQKEMRSALDRATAKWRYEPRIRAITDRVQSLSIDFGQGAGMPSGRSE